MNFCLVSHLIGGDLSDEERINCKHFDARWPISDKSPGIDARAGFVVNPTNLKVLVEYYFPSFEGYQWNRKMMLEWWNRISRFLEPVHIKNEYATYNEFFHRIEFGTGSLPAGIYQCQ